MISLTSSISMPDEVLGRDRYPKLCIMLKLFESEWVNDVTKVARNHSSSFYPKEQNSDTMSSIIAWERKSRALKPGSVLVASRQPAISPTPRQSELSTFRGDSRACDRALLRALPPSLRVSGESRGAGASFDYVRFSSRGDEMSIPNVRLLGSTIVLRRPIRL